MAGASMKHLQKRIEMLEARIRKLEELRRLKRENEILRFNIESLLKYIEETGRIR